MSAVGDARKRAAEAAARMHDADGWNTGPDAETVPVPRALVEALHRSVGETLATWDGGWYPSTLVAAARALVDAVERPTTGGDDPNACPTLWHCGSYPCEDAPAAPVSEARCRCGHKKDEHFTPPDGGPPTFCNTWKGRPVPPEFCGCTAFTPDTPPTTPDGEL